MHGYVCGVWVPLVGGHRVPLAVGDVTDHALLHLLLVADGGGRRSEAVAPVQSLQAFATPSGCFRYRSRNISYFIRAIFVTKNIFS